MLPWPAAGLPPRTTCWRSARWCCDTADVTRRRLTLPHRETSAPRTVRTGPRTPPAILIPPPRGPIHLRTRSRAPTQAWKICMGTTMLPPQVAHRAITRTMTTATPRTATPVTIWQAGISSPRASATRIATAPRTHPTAATRWPPWVRHSPCAPWNPSRIASPSGPRGDACAPVARAVAAVTSRPAPPTVPTISPWTPPCEPQRSTRSRGRPARTARARRPPAGRFASNPSTGVPRCGSVELAPA